MSTAFEHFTKARLTYLQCQRDAYSRPTPYQDAVFDMLTAIYLQNERLLRQLTFPLAETPQDAVEEPQDKPLEPRVEQDAIERVSPTGGPEGHTVVSYKINGKRHWACSCGGMQRAAYSMLDL